MPNAIEPPEKPRIFDFVGAFRGRPFIGADNRAVISAPASRRRQQRDSIAVINKGRHRQWRRKAEIVVRWPRWCRPRWSPGMERGPLLGIEQYQK